MDSDGFDFQTTILNGARLSGVGVHSGSSVSIAFKPAGAETGVVFRRKFADGSVQDIQAIASRIAATDLCTALGGPDGAGVFTVEHLLAAIYAMGIDNLVVEIDNDEVPIMDGSAIVFVETLDRCGKAILDVKRRYLRVVRPVRVEAGPSWAEFLPHEGARFEIDVDFDCDLIGRQSWKGEITPRTFRDSLARARTFGFIHDVEKLWAAGRALGASLENSVMVCSRRSVVNPEGLRFSDEFVRHKALDAVGDLALARARFIGCYRSYRGGHRLNSLALHALLGNPDAFEMVESLQPRIAHHGGEPVAVGGPMRGPATL